MPKPIHVIFAAGEAGPWRIDRVDAIVGNGLAQASKLNICEGAPGGPVDRAAWQLRGTTSNSRYTAHTEIMHLSERQEGLGRKEATRAALIPIRKTEAWWSLAQDERRAIFEEQSHHIAIGLDYLPAIARRLHHCRELGEPFDFLTWFEYAPEHEAAFEDMVGKLRQTAEWRYVDREVDIRLTRDSSLP